MYWFVEARKQVIRMRNNWGFIEGTLRLSADLSALIDVLSQVQLVIHSICDLMTTVFSCKIIYKDDADIFTDLWIVSASLFFLNETTSDDAILSIE